MMRKTLDICVKVDKNPQLIQVVMEKLQAMGGYKLMPYGFYSNADYIVTNNGTVSWRSECEYLDSITTDIDEFVNMSEDVVSVCVTYYLMGGSFVKSVKRIAINFSNVLVLLDMLKEAQQDMPVDESSGTKVEYKVSDMYGEMIESGGMKNMSDVRLNEVLAWFE